MPSEAKGAALRKKSFLRGLSQLHRCPWVRVASVVIRVADRLAPIRQLGRLGSQRVGLGSRHQPLVMGGGCAVEWRRGRSCLLLADDLEAAGL